MTLEELCAVALLEGAGVSYDQVLSSYAYWRRLQSLQKAQSHPSPHLQVAMRSGVHEFGTLLQQYRLSDRKAVNRVSDNAVEILPVATQAMTWELGERLMDRAFQELPPLLRAAVPGWRKLSAGDQLKLFEEFATIITSGTSATESSHRRRIEARLLGDHAAFEQTFIQRAMNEFLPAQFSTLSKEKYPSCLGMSIMLAAFAKASNARFLYYTVVQDLSSWSNAVVGSINGGLAKQAKAHGIKDREMMKSFEGTYRSCLTSSLALQDWHHAVLIELSDGKWLNFDPYLRNVSVVYSDYRVQKAYRVLKKYGPVMPGLCLQLNDDSHTRIWAEWYMEEAEAILRVANRFHALIQLDELRTIDALIECPEMVTLMRLIQGYARAEEVTDPEPWTRKRLVLYWIQDDVKSKEVDFEAEVALFEGSAEGRRSRLLRLEKNFYHYFSMWLDIRAGVIRRRHTHPAIDAMLPGPAIGLIVLSNLVSHFADLTNKFEIATLLTSQTNCQMMWHEALGWEKESAWTDEQAAIMGAAQSSVQALPSVHDRCGIKLQRKPTKPRRVVV